MSGVPFVGMGFAVLAAAALAGQSLAVKRSTQDHRVTDVVAVMFGVNVLVFVPAAAVRYYPAYGLTVGALVAFAVGGLVGSLLARVALFIGIERLGASRAEPLKSTFPILSVLGAAIVLDETVTAGLVVGMLVIVAGVVAVTREARSSPVTAAGRRVWTDLSFPLLAAILLGIDPLFTKLGLAEGTPTMVGLTVRILAAATGFAAYRLWRRVRTGRRSTFTPTRWILVASLANTGYLAAYFLALDAASVAVVTPIVGVSPLLVVLGAAVFLPRDEAVTRRLGLAVALIVAGVTVVLVA